MNSKIASCLFLSLLSIVSKTLGSTRLDQVLPNPASTSSLEVKIPDPGAGEAGGSSTLVIVGPLMDGRLGSCPCGAIMLLKKPVIFPPVSLPSDRVEVGREVVVDAEDRAAPSAGPES